MDILEYLISLLKLHKEIGVEGLGTFFKKKIPGRYDSASHSFLPPQHLLEFSTDCNENSKLIQYIQSKRNITEDASRYFIKQFVEEIKTALESDDFELNGLGKLSLIEGKIIFKAGENNLATYDYFALPKVTEIASNKTDENTITTISKSIEEISEETNTHLFTEDKSEITTEAENPEQEAIETVPEENTLSNENEESSSIIPEKNIDTVVSKTLSSDASYDKESENIETSSPVENNADTEVETTQNKKDSTEQTSTVADENNTNVLPDELPKTAEETSNPENIEEEKIYEEISDVSTISIPDGKPIEIVNPEELQLKTTTHSWDFNDTVEDEVSNENELTEEPIANKEQIAEETVKNGTPLYQKVSLAILILIITMAIAYYFEPQAFNGVFSNKENDTEKMVIPVATPELKTQTDSLSFADSIMNAAQKSGLDIEPAKDTLKVSSSTKTPNPIYTYDIIAAAFAKDSEAMDYINYMKKRGFEAKIADMPGKLFKKISIASYNNLDSAQHNLNRLRKQLKNDKIYIQKIKNN